MYWTSPPLGLHMDDVKKLIKILNRLADGGNTIIVIEHNMDVIKWRGLYHRPGALTGGTTGAWVIARGSPEEVAQNPDSATGQYLKKILARN